MHLENLENEKKISDLEQSLEKEKKKIKCSGKFLEMFEKYTTVMKIMPLTRSLSPAACFTTSNCPRKSQCWPGKVLENAIEKCRVPW